ncbi:hypothetical protein PITCH_A30011 [uncultured Desulfobacterium sp.]|uniref:Uncharacterized protein n=1 Tax=uncultured Desulfobacterium sp. TaxID=201089 RepID=A0A445MZC3_9BACT|nr:hypothetical protein PITCH_A30011 [uncultured Desulfobacterium sp.]
MSSNPLTHISRTPEEKIWVESLKGPKPIDNLPLEEPMTSLG